MFPEIFMFFDKDRLPVAVFKAETLDRATFLFSRLYKKEWVLCVTEDKVYVTKETDVTFEEWERIAAVLKRPSCKIELAQYQEMDLDRLIQSAAMKHARDCYLENVRKKSKKKMVSKWGII